MARKHETWADVMADNGPPDQWMDDMSSTDEVTETDVQREKKAKTG
jgi:hypothetical protein